MDFLQTITQKIFHSENRKKIVKNISWLFVGEIGSRIARGILTIIAARLLGASTFGIFTYILAFGGIVTFFEDAGIGMFTTREIAKSPTEKYNIFTSSLNLKIILIIISIVVFFTIGTTLSINTESFLLIIAVSIVLLTDAFQGFFVSVLRAQERMHQESYIKIISASSVFFFGLLFISLAPTATNLALGYALGGLVGLGFALFYIRNYLKKFTLFRIKKQYIRDIFKTSWPYTIVLLSSLMILNVDTLFLGAFTNSETVGQYNAANRLVQIAYILPQVITITLFPRVVQNIRENNYIQTLFKKINITLFIGATITVIGSILLAPVVIPFLFGAEYQDSIQIFTILSLGFIPVFLGQNFNNFVFAFDNQKSFVAINILGFLLNIGLNILLIPAFGTSGAAFATVTSLCIIHGYTGIKIYTHIKHQTPLK